MEAELQALIKVSASVAASMAYARFAASSTSPGKLRLAALLPVAVLLPFLPFRFTSLHLRAISAFFLVWLAVFKLLLLAFAAGPLRPSLPLLTFIAASSLPVKIRSARSSPTRSSSFPILIPTFIKLFLLFLIIPLYDHRSRIPRCLLLSLYCLHVYLALEVVLCSAVFLAGATLGLDLEPVFDAPYKSTSLQDFWGRRWNLMITAILRPSVYFPVRSRFGTAAGVVAVFLVSGLMHEWMFYYITMEPPTGEVMLFFLIHGVCTVAEVRAKKAWRWRPLPKAVTVPVTLGFVAVTGLRLFFPPVLRGGAEETTIEECLAMVEFAKEGGREIYRRLRWRW